MYNFIVGQFIRNLSSNNIFLKLVFRIFESMLSFVSSRLLSFESYRARFNRNGKERETRLRVCEECEVTRWCPSNQKSPVDVFVSIKLSINFHSVHVIHSTA